MKGITLQVFHILDLFQSMPKFLEMAPAHGSFFVTPPSAAGQDVEVFAITGELDFDLILNLLPRLAKELTFKLAQPATRSA